MRKRATQAALVLGLLAAVVAATGVVAAQEGRPIAIAVNGQVHELTPRPKMVDGRVLVPVRGLLELADAKVEWDPSDRSVTVTRGEHRAVLVTNRRTITADGRAVALDVPPKFIDGSVYAPLRAIAESLGATVRWNETLHMAMLTAPRLPKQMVVREAPGALDERPGELGPPPYEVPDGPVEPPRRTPDLAEDDVVAGHIMRASLHPPGTISSPEIA